MSLKEKKSRTSTLNSFFLSDKTDSFSRKKFKKRKPRLLKMSNSFSKSIKILKQINIEQ